MYKKELINILLLQVNDKLLQGISEKQHKIFYYVNEN